MTDESEPLKPGFASEEPDDPEDAPLPKDLEVAHYGGLEPEAAHKVWESETLCGTCIQNSMCRVADHTIGPLIVVSRCLAYIPTTG